MVYLQNVSEVKMKDSINYQSTIKPDDLLMIIVSAPDPEVAVRFNLPAVAVLGSNNLSVDNANTPAQYQTYLVDKEGVIQFPIIGALKIGGLSRELAIEKLVTELKKYIKNPIVNLRIVNYKFSVIGEVNAPGEYTLNSERITLLQALAKAGDLTIYGDRTKILVMRDINGIKTHAFVDITNADFMNSPYYYLSQNDVIYIEPNKTKINSSVVGPNISLIISGASVILSVIVALILR